MERKGWFYERVFMGERGRWSVVRGGKILRVGWAKMFVFGGREGGGR